MSKLVNYVLDSSLLENLTKKGIYKITHLSKTDLFYIGSASGNFNGKKCQKGFYRRFLEHLRALKHKNHDSKYLQNVVNKHGIDGIRFEILEIVETDDRKLILEREQYYLDTLEPQYNSSKTARCPTVEFTDERKKAMSIRMKGKSLPSEVYDVIRTPVYQFSKSGVFIKMYPSIEEAAMQTKTDRASISKCASGKRLSAGNYLWSFTESIFISKNKPLIYQYTLDDQFIRSFETLEELKKEFNLSSSTSIRSCIAGKQNKAYGFKWKKY